MNYELFYDAANETLTGWNFIKIGVLFSIIGALLVFWSPVKSLFVRSEMFAKFFFGFSLFWTVLATSAIFFANTEAKSSSEQNTCRLIEGVVENFKPMPYSGHQLETFEVQNVKFGYSDYSITGGFNNTSSHGGPIVEGLRVRICFLYRKRTNSNLIVRLEVASKE